MMQSIEQLHREHAAIRTALQLLEAYAGKMRAGKAVSASEVETVLAFLVDAGERCHCAREERFLFPLLQRRGTSRDARCITVLLVEHGAAREVLRTLTHLASSLEADADSRDTFAQMVEVAVPMLRNHLEKEERSLYPLAETVLTPEDDAALIRQFTAHDRDELGHSEAHANQSEALVELARRHGIATPF